MFDRGEEAVDVVARVAIERVVLSAAVKVSARGRALAAHQRRLKVVERSHADEASPRAAIDDGAAQADATARAAAASSAAAIVEAAARATRYACAPRAPHRRLARGTSGAETTARARASSRQMSKRSDRARASRSASTVALFVLNKFTLSAAPDLQPSSVRQAPLRLAVVVAAREVRARARHRRCASAAATQRARASPLSRQLRAEATPRGRRILRAAEPRKRVTVWARASAKRTRRLVALARVASPCNSRQHQSRSCRKRRPSSGQATQR